MKVKVTIYDGEKTVFTLKGEKLQTLETGKNELRRMVKKYHPVELEEDLALYLSGRGSCGGYAVEIAKLRRDIYIEYEEI